MIPREAVAVRLVDRRGARYNGAFGKNARL